ncbi:MAG: flagellar hook-associated protein FlgK [Paracoccaceae bacterium]
MSGLFDIGRTGIETYKHALSVTGQNIANAGTEGYHRREVLVSERKITQSDSLSIQDQLGLGAEVDKVSRAFDTLSFFKLIKTNSALESAKTVSDHLVNLENSVVSNNNNLFSDVNNFFEALNRVQGAPNEIPERQAALIAAEQLATRMSTFAAELSDLKSNLLKEAKIVVGTTNQVIDGLVEVQRSLQTVGATNFSPSSLLDQRDQLLMELSDNLDISIQYQESEKVRVGLGQNFGPNDLIDGFQYKELTLEANAEEIEFFLDGELTNDISGGRLGGILKVYDIVEQTIGNLNDYAITLANEFNQIQKAGVGLDGKQALNIFDIPTVEVLKSDGTTSYLALSPDALLEDEYSLQYLKESNSFINIVDNKEVQFDGGFLTLENKKLFIEDMPNDGETITIKPIANVAQNISVALEDPAQLAAAKSLSITNDTKNIGSSLVTLTSSAISETAPQFSISEDFKGSTSAASAKSFRSDLHVSLIDEDVSEINVGAFLEQSSARFPLTDAEIIDL